MCAAEMGHCGKQVQASDMQIIYKSLWQALGAKPVWYIQVRVQDTALAFAQLKPATKVI